MKDKRTTAWQRDTGPNGEDEKKKKKKRKKVGVLDAGFGALGRVLTISRPALV
jgi:hypothetical protein